MCVREKEREREGGRERERGSCEKINERVRESVVRKLWPGKTN